MSDPQACVAGKPRRPSLEERLYDWLGFQWCGNTYAPGDRLHLDLSSEQIANTSNDGFELWIGTATEWHWHCRHSDALKLARFIIWTWWVKSTWFGLRRWFWYKLLTRRCDRHKRWVKEANREQV